MQLPPEEATPLNESSGWPAAENSPPPHPAIPQTGKSQTNFHREIREWERAEARHKEVLELQRQTAHWQALAHKRQRQAQLLTIIITLVIIIGLLVSFYLFLKGAANYG